MVVKTGARDVVADGDSVDDCGLDLDESIDVELGKEDVIPDSEDGTRRI